MTMLKKLGVASATALVAGAALAAPSPPDTSALVSFIDGMWAPISAVIGAFTMVIIGVKGWKLVRRA